jgi:hypothetical protein
MRVGADVAHIAGHLPFLVGAVKLLEDLGMFLGADPHLVGARHEGGEALLAGGRVGRTAGEG